MKIRFTLGILSALALSVVLLAQNAQELYQRALVQEQSAGNLKEAIKLYSQAAKSAGKDRALAAKAWIRIADSQEKLGQHVEAAAAYDEVLRTYPEQQEQAALAQIRRDELRKTLLTNSQKPVLTDVSSVTNPLFESYCASCHNAAKKTAGLDLGALNAKNVSENTAMWENIRRRLLARRDPPTGSPRPDDATYRSAISKIELALDGAYPNRASAASDSAERVTDLELATRMAAFLWGSTPDASLLEDAQHGKLKDPAVVDRQVRRMLRDPKSANLVSMFFAEWLSLNRLKKAQVDAALFPQFDVELQESMETETRLFLESQLRENHNALDLWTANYTYLNERLARHYGIAQVTGKNFRKVTWPDNTRAGILGQAGPLTVLSTSTRTSPTQRGIYVFSKYLGMTAPAPPANVPPLSGSPDNGERPMRDRLAAHKANPSCANCHATFDPLGLALENFDATGRWRTTDGSSAIDASGAFIDATRFNGPAELRSGLLKYRDAYYSNVTQQLLGYALNRKGLRLYDYEMPSVRAIVHSAAANEYRWSSIISGIVSSAPFQMKNVVP